MLRTLGMTGPQSRLVVVTQATLLAANLLAAWPGHRAARLRPGRILREE